MVNYKRPAKEKVLKFFCDGNNISLRQRGSQKFDPEYIVTDEFQTFSDETLWSNLLGLQQGHKETAKRHLLALCANQLIIAGLKNKTVRDKRTSNDELRSKVWDALCKNGFAIKCSGSQQSQMITRYNATSKILGLQNWSLQLLQDLVLQRNSREKMPTSNALVVIRDEDKNPVTLRSAARSKGIPIQEIKSYVIVREDAIEQINRSLLQYTWTAVNDQDRIYQINPCLREIHSRGFKLACRLYTFGTLGGQSIPKTHRKRLLINGQPTTEIDGKSYQIRLMYHHCGIDRRGDLYKIDPIFPKLAHRLSIKQAKVLRKLVKYVTVIMANTSSKKQAILSIAKLIRENKRKKFIYKAMQYERITNTEMLIDRILNGHPPQVQKCFFQSLGLRMMSVDGEIMFKTIHELACNRNIPALCIHDAIFVRQQDIDAAKEVFKDCYHKIMGFHPELECKK